MAEWRRVAVDLIPQLAKDIANTFNKTELWDILRTKLIDASQSGNSEACQSIVKYYRWCVSADRQRLPNDVQTAAVVTFLEKMVRTQELTAILLKWLSKDEVLNYTSNVVHSAGIEMLDFIREFRAEKVNKHTPRRRKLDDGRWHDPPQE
ncbi:MAG: hypothetical protein V4719_29225 [Planctomycetota bacterium]